MLVLKKPQYIRKYDFIRYFTRNEDEWFWPTKALTDYIDFQAKQLSHGAVMDDEDDEDFGDNEIDSYEFFKEYKQEFSDMDNTDAKIIEGNKIDKLSQEFIKEKFSDCEVIDLTDIRNNDANASKTLEILKTKDNVILFQCTFIYKEMAIAKPDGFVKYQGKYYLYETKGTSSEKMSHLVDVIYQANVVNWVLNKELQSKLFQCFLCIARYCLADKYEIPLIECIHPSFKGTSGNISQKEKKELNGSRYSEDALEAKQIAKINGNGEITYIDVVENRMMEFDEVSKARGATKISLEKKLPLIEEILNEDKFDDIIDKLIQHEINENPQLRPCTEYKMSGIKSIEYWINLRNYYSYNPKYFQFSYSGNLISYKLAYEFFLSGNTNENDLLKFALDHQSEGSRLHLYCLGCGNAPGRNEFELGSYSKDTIKLFNEIKPKKVYFDFESINLASRVVDGTVPFMQICNQVSVIYDHGDGKLVNKDSTNEIGDHIVLDPQNITYDSFKEVIDSLYPNSDQENYSYIVYNKSFECSRLKEMAELINEPEYDHKVDVIVRNIFDLADFFTIGRPGYIVIKSLKGFYSIKKVLPLVGIYAPELFKLTKCVDYKKDLEIHNGSQAQGEANNRFFGTLNDEQWEERVVNLKKYCENDVRAMIAIEYWIKKIIKV